MRDLIWTVIVIWFIYKLIDIFKGASAKKSFHNSKMANEDSTRNQSQSSHSDKDIKSAVQKHLNNDGEYVDFEEVK